MSKPVIEVKNISKRYRIGGPVKKEETFAGQVFNTLLAPVKNLRELRSLNRFKEDDETTFWALQDINFDVQKGEVLGIIGHNGAGKSTLLKLLSRITEPTTGEIILRGRVNSLLEVGTGFHPDLSGRDNIYMNGTILGMTKKEIDRKLEEIIDFSGVAKYIDTPVKRYSSGMTVRLAFSVAAHLEPEILIVDEVLAVGDLEFQKKCLGKMKEVSGQGRTVLFVSHNMGSVQTLCSRGILLGKGSIISDSDIDSIVRLYSKGLNTTTTFIQKSKSIQKAVLTKVNPAESKISDHHFMLELHSTQGFNNIKIDLAFKDNGGKIVSHFRSEWKGYDFFINKGENLFRFVIKDLILRPETYSTVIYIYSNEEIVLHSDDILYFNSPIVATKLHFDNLISVRSSIVNDFTISQEPTC